MCIFSGVEIGEVLTFADIFSYISATCNACGCNEITVRLDTEFTYLGHCIKDGDIMDVGRLHVDIFCPCGNAINPMYFYCDRNSLSLTLEMRNEVAETSVL